jgi:hypothetical protein
MRAGFARELTRPTRVGQHGERRRVLGEEIAAKVTTPR